jgi:tRNA nucleotidyltransferase/poly(A) polymerase
MFKELSHKTFNVGGSIRNQILGREANDLDFVIENTTEEELLAVFPEAEKVHSHAPSVQLVIIILISSSLLVCLYTMTSAVVI